MSSFVSFSKVARNLNESECLRMRKFCEHSQFFQRLCIANISIGVQKRVRVLMHEKQRRTVCMWQRIDKLWGENAFIFFFGGGARYKNSRLDVKGNQAMCANDNHANVLRDKYIAVPESPQIP